MNWIVIEIDPGNAMRLGGVWSTKQAAVDAVKDRFGWFVVLEATVFARHVEAAGQRQA